MSATLPQSMESERTKDAARTRPWAAAGLGLVGALALAKLAIHLATTGRFGYEFFIDELYFLDCARHLAWGYVDMPPLFPALTALIVKVFGESLLVIRAVTALTGAALVLLTGLLARELGGRRFAQGLAALAVVLAPIYLATYSISTMNQFEPLLVTAAALVMAKVANGGSPRLWLVFGALAGLGLLNKHSMALFGAAAVVGLLASPERRAFRERWIWLAGALSFFLFLPNLVWVIQHHFPHQEMLANIKRNGRNVSLTPLRFLWEQVLMLNPLAAPVWLAGLGWLLFGREGKRHRALGVLYLTVIALLLALDGRVYYAAPAYPLLLAAGGVALEAWTARLRARGAARAALLAVVTAGGLLLAPFAIPCLPPEVFIRYTKTLGLEPPPIETHRLGPLPQLFADRFGWREMAEVVARAYATLPPDERAKAAVFAQNYGQAGAIDHYGPQLGLPRAISGHLTHWYWGPREYTGEVMVVLDDDRETLSRYFDDVTYAGRVEHRYSMPYEHFDVWICRKPKPGVTLQKYWPKLKKFD